MRRWGYAAGVVYLVVVGVGVFGPEPSKPLDRAGDAVRRAGDEVRRRVGDGPGRTPAPPERGIDVGVPLVGDVSTEEAGNVALFVPFGVLFPLLWPRWRWWTVAAGAALSGLVEGVQLAFLDWRTPSLSDIGWNTLGAGVGFVPFCLFCLAGPLLRHEGPPGGPSCPQSK